MRAVNQGQYLGKDLQFPELANGAVGGSVVFAPDNPPSTAFEILHWNFGSTTILTALPDSTIIGSAYRDRASFDRNTLALELRNLTLDDSGKYGLSVQTTTENITNVRLIGPEESLIEGESSANITTNGTGTITSVQWMKDNSPLFSSNRIIFSSDNRSVSISPVQRSDSGEYHCTYTNPVSSGTAKLILIINYGPDDVSITVPFELNSARHKDLRYENVQRILQLDAMARPHEYFFLDEAGFNLQKRRQRGHNIIGQRAISEVPGQRGGNLTLCAAMGSEGLVHRHAVLGSYNTQRLLTFLEELRDILLDCQQHHPGPAHHIYVIIWDNVRFHRTNQIREWFTTNSNQFLNVCLPPYSPFLNPIEEFFSSWRWKVYDRQPYTRENLLRAMELACVDIPVEAFQGWIPGRFSRGAWQETI
ncbi:hypothetical protein ROHU_019452 [Labeo rohita]|uniref:Ig-like domain-containing protein n=1 Tax=Labeo rohita TaxID=84645 RepID=A0A498NBA0_LABRO|nr:hypothetical protein ROHU_019452 [Labeo rohita]